MFHKFFKKASKEKKKVKKVFVIKIKNLHVACTKMGRIRKRIRKGESLYEGLMARVTFMVIIHETHNNWINSLFISTTILIYTYNYNT